MNKFESLNKDAMMPHGQERESRLLSLERPCSEKEERIISALQESAGPNKRPLPEGMEFLGEGKDTSVFRVVDSPGVVFKIVRNKEANPLKAQSIDIAKAAQHVGTPTLVQFGDHRLGKIAEGIPACAFLKDKDGNLVAIVAQEAKVASNWAEAVKVVPTLEKQGIGLNDFREYQNFGEVTKEDGTPEPVVLDLGSVKLLSEMDMKSYERTRDFALQRAQGGKIQGLR